MTAFIFYSPFLKGVDAERTGYFYKELAAQKNASRVCGN
jgi:hypothetical protein